MQNLTVALLQTSLVWENREQGLASIQERLEKEAPVADLIVLPEMFTTGFTMNARENAEKMDGPAVTWMQDYSRKHQCWISGSLIIQEDDRYYNRLVVAGPDGLNGWYDKRHLFRMAGEDQVYQAGKSKLITNIRGWKVSFWICYDLRFPVWIRNRNQEYDAAVFVANWPERRASHWSSLLKARAIENQCCLAGVNRIGSDGNSIPYSGGSVLLNAQGEPISNGNSEDGWVTGEWDAAALRDYREKFPAWKDADDFLLTP